ncbi:hypothetical protein SARC_15187, partial [Sphaeroforma arctica JP610]
IPIQVAYTRKTYSTTVCDTTNSNYWYAKGPIDIDTEYTDIQTYFYPVCFSSLVCFPVAWPFVLLALVFSMRASKALRLEQRPQALKYSKHTYRMLRVTVVGSILVYVLATLLVVKYSGSGVSHLYKTMAESY